MLDKKRLQDLTQRIHDIVQVAVYELSTDPDAIPEISKALRTPDGRLDLIESLVMMCEDLIEVQADAI